MEVLICERSAATPGVSARSNRERCDMSGDCFRRRDMGCPTPPAAPSTDTFMWLAREVDIHLATGRPVILMRCRQEYIVLCRVCTNIQ